MTTFANDLNEQLFTELTSAEAAIIQGGEEEYRSDIYFKEVWNTSNFNVSSGKDIKLSSFTRSSSSEPQPVPSNTGFMAELQNLDTDQKDKKWIPIGDQTTYWNNVKGGRYKFQFRDAPGPLAIDGRVVVNSGDF